MEHAIGYYDCTKCDDKWNANRGPSLAAALCLHNGIVDSTFSELRDA